MKKEDFVPEHISASKDDLAGNDGIGRYILLPGSDGRAKAIAEHFNDVHVKTHARAHNVYLGSLQHQGKNIDVATVASGMGCPSMEIILHELYHLGAKRFLRIGTAGSLQPDKVKVGDIINVQASVRDEDTTTHYMPTEVPAVASVKFTSAIFHTAEHLGIISKLHTGIVHCKGSLYAREFSAGPRSMENEAYMSLLSRYGVLASEMETAALFIQSQLYNYELSKLGNTPACRVLAGAILAIISAEEHFNHSGLADKAIEESVILGLETIKTLAADERRN
jgi:uridine phosphorylase